MRLTEIVEMILSTSDVGEFPPPIARWSRLYPGGWAQLLRGDLALMVPRAPRARRSAAAQRGSRPFKSSHASEKLKTREEQSFDSMRTTGK